MLFRSLLNNYKDSNCPIGDLANDVTDDIENNHINVHTYTNLKKRMNDLNACDNALNALDKAYTLYKTSK